MVSYRSSLEALASDFNPLPDYRPPSRRGKSTAGGAEGIGKSPLGIQGTSDENGSAEAAATLSNLADLAKD